MRVIFRKTSSRFFAASFAFALLFAAGDAAAADEVKDAAGGIFLFLSNAFDSIIQKSLPLLQDVGKYVFYVSFSLSILILVFDIVVKRNSNIGAFLPNIIMAIFVFHLCFNYTSVLNTGNESPKTGFIGVSQDVLRWTFGLGLKLQSGGNGEALDWTYPQPTVSRLNAYEVLNNPGIIVREAGLISARTGWSIVEDEEETKLGWYTSVVHSFLSLLTTILVYVVCWVIAIVIFLNLVLFKFFGIIAMILFPLILVPWFQDTGRAALNNLIAFGVKFLAYGVVISLCFAGFAEILKILNQTDGDNGAYSRTSLIHLSIMIVMMGYLTVLLPGKLAQLFGGSIAFGDGSIAGLLTSAIEKSIIGTAAIGVTTSLGLGKLAGKTALKGSSLGVAELGSRALLASNPTSKIGNILAASAAGNSIKNPFSFAVDQMKRSKSPTSQTIAKFITESQATVEKGVRNAALARVAGEHLSPDAVQKIMGSEEGMAAFQEAIQNPEKPDMGAIANLQKEYGAKSSPTAPSPESEGGARGGSSGSSSPGQSGEAGSSGASSPIGNAVSGASSASASPPRPSDSSPHTAASSSSSSNTPPLSPDSGTGAGLSDSRAAPSTPPIDSPSNKINDL